MEKDELLNARDRAITLVWEPVKLMLDKMLAARDTEAFRLVAKKTMAGTQYTWANGTLTPEPPVFCEDRCNGQGLGRGNADCRPCKSDP